MQSNTYEFPQLTPREINVLSALFLQSMHNPDFAADLWINPRDQMLGYNLSQEEIDRITSYFKYVGNVVDKNIKADWVP